MFCTKGLQKKETNVASCTVLLDELKDRVSKFDLDGVLKFGFELAEKYDVEHFDCRVSGRQRRIPEALRSSIIMTSNLLAKTMSVLRRNCGLYLKG